MYDWRQDCTVVRIAVNYDLIPASPAVTRERMRNTECPRNQTLIIWGSHIRTLDPDLPTCSAVAIKDGLVIATGDDDTIRACAVRERG